MSRFINEIVKSGITVVMEYDKQDKKITYFPKGTPIQYITQQGIMFHVYDIYGDTFVIENSNQFFDLIKQYC